MGLLSGKTVNCLKCGAEFTRGLLSSETLCEECRWENTKEQTRVLSIQLQKQGIQEYYKNMPKPFNKMPADIETIMAYRDSILEKYRRSDVVTADDFMNAYASADSWDDDECMNFTRRVCNSILFTHKRMSFAEGKFIVSHEYDGVVVDFDEVFAVAVVKGLKGYTKELDGAYMCAMFTNNPFFPAIALAFCPQVKKGFFSTQAKMEAEAIQMLGKAFNTWCCNLTYPVMSLKEFKNLIKQEGAVRGNMSIQMMNALLSRADCGSPFWGIDSTMPETIPFGISHAMADYGYLSAGDLHDNLMIDKKSEKFWMYYISKYDEERKQYNLF